MDSSNQMPKSPVPNKAKRLLREGKITKEEYDSIVNSDRDYHTPSADSEHDVDKIPWGRLSKNSEDLKNIGPGPLVVPSSSVPASVPKPVSPAEMMRQMSATSSASSTPSPTPSPTSPSSSTTTSSLKSILKDPLAMLTPPSAAEIASNVSSRRRLIAERKAALVQARQEDIRQRQSAKRHDHITKNNDKWKTKILPRWDEVKGTKEVDKLVALGLPTHMRAELWVRMVGNRLQIQEDIYNGCVELAEELERRKRAQREERDLQDTERIAAAVAAAASVAVDGIVSTVDAVGESEVGDENEVRTDAAAPSALSQEKRVEENTRRHQDGEDITTQSASVSATSDGSGVDGSGVNGNGSGVGGSGIDIVGMDDTAASLVAGDRLCLGRAESLMLIERDLPRTFPTLSFFHDGGPMAQALDRVLKAYAFYRPDIGYVQGMSYVVAVFLLYMDEFQAFICLANLLNNNRTNLDFYLLHRPAISAYVKCFDTFFAQFLPLLYQHFEEEGITSEMFLLDWYMTVFSKAMSLEVAARMWDCYLYYGEVFILRGALGLLRLFATKLSSMSMEKILPFLSHVPEDSFTADDLMNSISQIKISKKRYESVRQQHVGKITHSAHNYPQGQGQGQAHQGEIGTDRDRHTNRRRSGSRTSQHALEDEDDSACIVS